MEHTVVSRPHVEFAKAWFFVVFATGAAVILLLDLTGQPKSWSIAFSALLIVAYAVCAFRVPALRARPDQVADNCYYLGLLFTLASLALALYKFANTDLAAEAILRNFGIAITSTIVGLALRVLISQLRQDPEDLEYEARTALAESVRQLRADLDQSIAEVQRFADGARQAFQETAVESTKSTSDVIGKATKRFEKSTDAASGKFDEAASRFEQNSKTFEAAFGRILSSVDSFESRIGAVRAEEDLVETATAPGLQRLNAKIDALASTVGDRDQLLSATLARLETLGGTLEALARSADVLDRSAGGVGSLAASLEQVGRQVESLGTSVTGATAAAGRFQEGLATAASEQAGQGAEVLAALRAAADQAAASAAERLQMVEKAADEALATLRKLNAEFSTSGDTVQLVRRELAELAAWIVARIEKQ